METVYQRDESLFFDQKGPLVLSATIHLVALLGWFLWSLISPNKPPEELVFILSEPPPPASVDTSQLPSLQYEPEQVDIPKIEPFKPKPKPKPVEALPQLPPDPVVVKPIPTKPEPVKPEPAKPAPKMSMEDFQKQFGPIKETNRRPDNKPVPSKPVDLKTDLRKLNSLNDLNLPNVDVNAMSPSDQSALLSYFERFKARLAQETQTHSVGAQLLRARVRFDVSATGVVSNVGLLSSSGDSVFDRKVLDAFARLRNYQAPPSGQAYRGLTIEVVQE